MSHTTILVPVDFGADSDAALEAAQHEALRLHADLVLLHAVETIVPDFPGVTFLPAEPLPARVQERLARKLETKAASLRAHGLRVWSIVRQGPAWLEVVELADACDASLIVLGGRGASRRHGIGDTTEKVLRTSNAPVLVAQASRRVEAAA